MTNRKCAMVRSTRTKLTRLCARATLGSCQVGRYRQFKRMRKVLRRLKGYIGRVMQDIQRQLGGCGHNIRMILAYLKALWAEILAMLMATFALTGAPSGAKSGFRAFAA
jgi:transposase, IS5 family